MMLLLTGLTAAAAAGLGEVHLSAGVEAATNDPFVRTAGLRVSGALALHDRFSVGAVFAVYPLSAPLDYKPQLETLIDEWDLIADISRIRARGMGVVRGKLLEQRVGARSRALWGYVGLGGVYTVDADAYFGWEEQSGVGASAREIHPMTNYGVSGEVWWGSHGVRLNIERSNFIETIMGSIQQQKSHTWVGVEAVWRLP